MARFKERWSKGAPAGCVVSETSNRQSPFEDGCVDFYGGFLVAESVPKNEFVNLIAIAPEMYNKLEELERVVAEWPSLHPDGDYLHGYVLHSIRELLNKVPGESGVEHG